MGLVTDPALQGVLQTAEAAKQQCLESVKPAADGNGLVVERDLAQLLAVIAQLRGLHREAVIGVRKSKQETAEYRQEVDRLHLQLQNLYYEQRHLRGEIAACESYSHQYLQLPLIPVEEFLQIIPELVNASDHDLIVARIGHEHQEREKLEKQRRELLMKKETLIAANNTRRQTLANLDEHVEKLIDATKPIQVLFEKDY